MKYSICNYLVAGLLSCSAGAADMQIPVGDSVANSFAHALAQVQNAKDLPLFLKMKPEDEAAYLHEVTVGNMTGFKPVHVTMPTHGEVTISSLNQSLNFDFRELGGGYLYIGKQKIKLDGKLKFAALRELCEKSLGPRPQAGWFSVLPEADASVKDWLVTVGAGAASAAEMVGGKLIDGTVSYLSGPESNLIKYYKTESEVSKRVNRGSNFITERFTCEGKKLDQVRTTAFVMDGTLQNPLGHDYDETLKVIPGSGYEISSSVCKPPARLNSQGIVRSSIRGCGFATGENIFKGYKYADFVPWAEACCAQTDCYENVSKALQETINSFVTRPGPLRSGPEVLSFPPPPATDK